MTGGSIVGDMAPYQAFAIGGLGSVRGYGEGAVGSGRSCLVANSELTLPFVCNSFTLYMFLRIYYICCIILLAWEVILESVELSSMIIYQQILIVLNQYFFLFDNSLWLKQDTLQPSSCSSSYRFRFITRLTSIWWQIYLFPQFFCNKLLMNSHNFFFCSFFFFCLIKMGYLFLTFFLL